MAGALAIGTPALAAPGAEAQLESLTGKLWNEQLRRFPELATTLGLDKGALADLRGKLDPWTREARADWVKWAAGAVKRLERIDSTALPQSAKVNREVLIDYYNKIATLGAQYPFGEAASGAYAPVAPYAISQLTGPCRIIPDLLDARHPIATSADCEAWLGRLAAFAAALDGSTAAFRMDVAAGVIPPRFVLDATLVQLQALRAPDATASALASALGQKASAAGIDGDWAGKAAAIVARNVYPALDRQIAAITGARAGASDDAGVWKLPGGARYYADALAYHTSSSRTPAEVHQLGLDQVAEITAEMDSLLGTIGLLKGTVGERVVALGQRPGEAYPENDAGRAMVLAEFRAAIERIRPRLPEVFANLPATPLDIRRVPVALEQASPRAYAQSGSLDGTHPGILYVNLQNVSEWSRFSIATTAFHEGIPGRLWEGATATAAPDIPNLRKRGTGYAAYSEGWGLYMEQVVHELGYYDEDPASRIGYLQGQLFRAARLVVDTGIHDQRWSRDRAISYLTTTTGQSASAMRREVDRYCVTPGQACAYMVGQMEWLRLRALARRLAGSGFDLRQFHQVIQYGRAPFNVVEEVVTASFNKRLSVLAMRTA